jgi:HSP20 family protein
MTLVKWNPSRSLWNFNDDVFKTFFDEDRYLSRNRDSYYPVVDIEENENAYLVSMELPGMEKKDIKISYKDDVLTISGEKKDQKEEKDKNYHYFERRFGKFERSFRIHTDVIEDKIDANFKDGVLTVEMPKAEIAKPKEIEVKVK